MERRNFLRLASMAGVGPLLIACAKTFRIPVDVMAKPAAGPGADRDPEGMWREAAAYARWAPSPHNVQPWRLRILGPTRSELYYDPRRLLPKTDPTGEFTSVGLAMFVEYLSIAMHPKGYKVVPEYVHKPLDYAAAKPMLFATLALEPFVEKTYTDRSLILQRKTSRLPYDGKPVEVQVMRNLQAIAKDAGHDFAWSSDKAMVDWTLDLNRFTLFEDLDDNDSRTELRKWIRCDADEAAAKKDGLWSHCMRFPGWLLKSFFDEHEKYRSGWRRDFCGSMLVKGMKGTRTVSWWSGSMDTPADWTNTGHMLAKSWLELTRMGVNLHPFGSIITNPKAYARLKDKLGGSVPKGRVWLLTRMGRSDVPPRSYRVEEPAIFMDDKELA
jgi:hypothetical protein